MVDGRTMEETEMSTVGMDSFILTILDLVLMETFCVLHLVITPINAAVMEVEMTQGSFHRVKTLNYL